MQTQTILASLAEARCMIADLLDGYPPRELCRDPREWLAEAREILEAMNWSIDE